MPTAQGQRVAIAYIAESTAGTTPATPQLTRMRTTAQRNLNTFKNILESNETRPNRQKRDIRHGFKSGGGPIGIEMVMHDHDDFWAALLGGSWATNVLKVGTTVSTFTLERYFPDIAQFQVFRGWCPASANIQIQPEQIVNATINGVAMTPVAISGTTIDTSGGITEPARDGPAFSSFQGTMEENGDSIAYVTGVTLDINSNRSLAPVVGSETALEVDDGEFTLTGTVTARFQNATLLNKFINETNSSLVVRLLEKGTSEWLEITVPKLLYTGGTIDPPHNGPCILSLPFRGLYDTSEATTLKLERSVAP